MSGRSLIFGGAEGSSEGGRGRFVPVSPVHLAPDLIEHVKPRPVTGGPEGKARHRLYLRRDRAAIPRRSRRPRRQPPRAPGTATRSCRVQPCTGGSVSSPPRARRVGRSDEACPPFGLDRCEQRIGHVLGGESPHRAPGDEIKRDEARSERAADRPPVPRRRGHARARCACSLDSAEEVDDSAPP